MRTASGRPATNRADGGLFPAVPGLSRVPATRRCPKNRETPAVEPEQNDETGARCKDMDNLQRYQRIAPFYDLLDLPFEHRRYARIRAEVLRGLSGRLLDAGVGTGRNIAHYDPAAEVVGIDLSPAMLRRAARRAVRADAAVDLRVMDVTSLDFPDGSFDAAVATFLFCVLPREQHVAALSEIGRVVRPGGTIRLLEYVRPSGALRRAVARCWEPWIGWAYGASFDRDVGAGLAESGLETVATRFVFSDLIKLVEARPARAARG